MEPYPDVSTGWQCSLRNFNDESTAWSIKLEMIPKLKIHARKTKRFNTDSNDGLL